MKRFLELETDPSCKVPPISSFISSIDGDKNSIFFSVANALHKSNNLNQIYSLVSFRTIIDLSPMSPKTPPTADELHPKNSYKWLYLIHSLASRKISDDTELESAKTEYFYNAFHKFVMEVDLSKPNVCHFLSGLLCSAARLMDYSNEVPKIFNSSEFYERISNICQSKYDFSPISMTIQDFSIPEIFEFSAPIPLEEISLYDIFFDADIYLKYSIFRFLLRLIKIFGPPDITDFKKIIFQFYDHYILGKIAHKVAAALFKGSEEEAYASFDVDSLETASKDIVDYTIRSHNFQKVLETKDHFAFSTSLSLMKSISKSRPKSIESFLLLNKQIGQMLEILLNSNFEVHFIIDAAFILAAGHWPLSEYNNPLRLLILSPSEKLRNLMSLLLCCQGDELIPELMGVIPAVAQYGSNSSNFFAFLTKFLPTLANPLSVVSELLDTLKRETEDINKMPGAKFYAQLRNYIPLNASYFDPQVCEICNDFDRVFTTQDIELAKTPMNCDKNIICTKITPMLIKSITLGYTSKASGRTPRTISVSIYSDEINDIKKDKLEWHSKSYAYYTCSQKSAKIKFPFPVLATGMSIVFENFWAQEKISENLYICHNIKSDSYICPTCGVSPYITLDIHVKSINALQYCTNINSKDACEVALENCNSIFTTAEKNFESIMSIRKTIEMALSPSNPMTANERTQKLNSLYNSQCLTFYQKMTKALQQVREIRISSGIFSNKLMDYTASLKDENNCYHCRSSFIRNCLNFFTMIPEKTFIQEIYSTFDVIGILFEYISDTSPYASNAISTLIAFCKSIPELTLKITYIFTSSLPNVSSQIVRLLCELEHIDDCDRPYRVKSIVAALIAAIDHMDSQASFTMLVLQPLLLTVCSSPIIIRNSATFQQFTCYNAWRKIVHKPPSRMVNPFGVIRSRVSMTSLFVKCQSESIRTAVKELLQSSSTLNNEQFKMVFNYTFSLLSDINELTLNTKQYFDLLLCLLNNEKAQRSRLQSDFFDKLISLLCNETEKIVSQEDSFYHDISVGFSVYTLIQFIDLFLKPVINLRYIIYRKQPLAVNIITNYFKLRSLTLQRSKFLDDSLNLMKGIIMRIMRKDFVLTSKSADKENDKKENKKEKEEEEEEDIIIPNPNGPRIMIEAAVEAVSLCPDIVIREIYGILFPPKEEAKIPVVMKKWSRHEDFIPGRLPHDPITSDQIGKCFRDIKTKLCVMLGMEMMLQEENNIELMVDNNIISLDLPIDNVYKRIWVPSRGDSPMEVYCRLTGLDGEATENIINSLPSEEVDDVPPETKYEYTTVLCDCGGFKQLINALNSDDLSNQTLKELVELLDTFALVKRNRIEMNKLNGSLQLFNVMKKLLQKKNPSKEIFKLAISTVASLIAEDPGHITNAGDWISFILGSFKEDFFRNNEELLSPFLALLPPIAARSSNLMERVLVNFIDLLKPSNANSTFNIFEDCQSLFILNGFAEFVLVIPPNPLGNTIRDLILKETFVADAISIIYKLFPLEEGRLSKKWNTSVDTPYLPSLLKTLIGMAHCHEKTQELFLKDDSKFIKLLLELEAITSHANIGEFAGNIIEMCLIEPSISKTAIDEIKTRKIEEAKAKAKAKREDALNKTKLVSPVLQAQLDDLTDQSWECCICHEGYEFLPQELLGIYVYVHVERSSSISNTATYFVCIHPSCHKKAKNTGRHGNNRQSEWEAASLRNSERPCNAIFPLPSQTLPPDSYKNALISFIESFNKGKLYFRSIMIDFKEHLILTANGKKIPLQHGGGSFSSNTAFWPFLINAGHLLLDTQTGETRSRLAYEKEAELQIAKKDNVIDALILSIWTLSFEEWEEAKIPLLKALIETKKIKEGDNLFERTKSVFIFYILINKIQKLAKKPSKNPVVMSENGSIKVSAHSGEKWISEFVDRISNEGAAVQKEWTDLGDELQDETLDAPDLKTLFLYSEISEEPEEFIKSCSSTTESNETKSTNTSTNNDNDNENKT